jgi:hypothetical protein
MTFKGLHGVISQKTELFIILWNICSKQKMWSQKKCALLGNSTVTTPDPVFSMWSTLHFHSNRDACNRGTVGSDVCYAVHAKAA